MSVIIWAVIAGFIIFQLYKVLGYDSEEITSRFKNEKSNKIIDITPKQSSIIEPIKVITSNVSDEVREVLNQIHKLDPNFTEATFLKGANKAYEMVIKAYTEQKFSTLKNLLSLDLYKELESQIQNSVNKQEKILVQTSASEIFAAELNGKIAILRVKYTSQQINLVKNSAGVIIEGNPSEIDQIEDHWSFVKDLSSSSPAWQIIAMS